VSRVLAFDLGSNTLRAVVYDCEAQRALGAFERIVKTADKLVDTGRIDDAAVTRIVDAVREALRTLGGEEDTVTAYATEALRRASNRDEVLRRIETETGVRFCVIDGEKEAALTLLAVRRRLEILRRPAERFVLVDIGGGSTEVTFVYGDTVLSRSFPVGIVTVAQRYGALSRIEAEMETLMAPVRAFIRDIYARYGRPDTFVATAGTPTTVAAMKLGQTYATYDPEAVNGTELSREELRVWLGRLLAMPFEKREETVGVGRSDLIAAGILIFEALFDVLELSRCIVVDDGLREGAAIEICGKLTNGLREETATV